ncbi:ParB N-terminal domain-containing protein [Limosilactobacillus reuteri]|uniref:ParB N-terminal domain-containing protein n=1 Tax=Limosilactobacillus reuteri TaxID=1598 RepID=UPI001E3DB47A|nr:ParB N-terminal domain-containing protein [Limosilactobacillus reuteri]MCC4518346.1 ParB N-terminal domain-containing protein [Limosilactobacillus reuteri]
MAQATITKRRNEITRFNAFSKDEVVGNIYRTYDYKQFSFNKVNRNVSEQHVNEIVNSIRADNTKMPIIQVNPKLEIIDGQHRFKALMKLGLPIYYYIDRQSNDEQIITINSKQTRWHLPEFIHARAEQNLPGYKELEELVKKYKGMLAPSGIVAIFSGSTDWSGGGMSKTVQQGKFQFGDKKKATNFLIQITDARETLSKKKQLNNSTIKCLWAFYNRKDINERKLFSLINDEFLRKAPRDRNGLMVYIGTNYNKSLRKNKIAFYQDYKGAFHFASEK